MAQSKGKVPSSEGKADQASEDMKREIICPLTLEATTKINHNPKAVNYGVTWEATISVDGSNEPGVWYSSQKGRGHSAAFEQLLNERKQSGEITWEEDGYYFSQDEGIAAREKYEQMILDGGTTITNEDGSEERIEVKANKRSWENKHQHFTNVSWEELIEKFPEIYKSTTKAEIAEDAEMSGEDSVTEEETTDVEETEVVAAVSDDEEDWDDEDEEWDEDEDDEDEYEEV